MTETDNLQRVIEVAQEAAEPNALLDLTSYAVVAPTGSHVERFFVDQEVTENRPRRRHGTTVVRTADSLVRLTTELGAQHGRAAIYANPDDWTVTAVLNDHESVPSPSPKEDAEPPKGHLVVRIGGPDVAAWRDHRIVLQLTKTPEWERWTEASGSLMSQQDFAEFVEDNLDEIYEPPGADVLELAQHFEAHKGVQFKSSQVLHSGQVQLTYLETIEARSGQTGEVKIPKELLLGMSPFEGSKRFEMRARLRYRINNGALGIGIILVHPERVERAVFDQTVEAIETGTTIKPYIATAI
jgi:hypothetical protein